MPKPRDRRVICIREGGLLEVADEPGFWVVSRRLGSGPPFTDSQIPGHICLLEVRPATLGEQVRWARARKPWKDTWRQEQRLADGGPRWVSLTGGRYAE